MLVVPLSRFSYTISNAFAEEFSLVKKINSILSYFVQPPPRFCHVYNGWCPFHLQNERLVYLLYQGHEIPPLERRVEVRWVLHEQLQEEQFDHQNRFLGEDVLARGNVFLGFVSSRVHCEPSLLLDEEELSKLGPK